MGEGGGGTLSLALFNMPLVVFFNSKEFLGVITDNVSGFIRAETRIVYEIYKNLFIKALVWMWKGFLVTSSGEGGSLALFNTTPLGIFQF